MKGITKFTLYIVLFMLMSSIAVFSAIPRIHEYGCGIPADLKTTILEDRDNDGIMDTFTSIWCDDSTGGFVQTGPIYYPEATKGRPINIWIWDELPVEKEIKLRKKGKKTGFNEYHLLPDRSMALYWYSRPDDCDTVFYSENTNAQGVDDFSLVGNLSVLPNPAISNTEINVTLKNNNRLLIRVLNQDGAELFKIDDSHKIAGDYSFNFDVTNLSSGMYYIQTFIGTKATVNKLVVLK